MKIPRQDWRQRFMEIGLSYVALAFFLQFDFGWALGMLIGILMHEAGHKVFAELLNHPTKGIRLIPGIGAYVETIDPVMDLNHFALLTLGGPLIGTCFAILPLMISLLTGSPWFAVLALLIVLLNLTNMLPLLPTDGGVICFTIGYSIHRFAGVFVIGFGFAVCLALANLTNNLGLVIFTLAVGFFGLYGYRDTSRQVRQCQPVTRTNRIIFGGLYLVMVACLTGMVLHIVSLPGVREMTTELYVLKSLMSF